MQPRVHVEKSSFGYEIFDTSGNKLENRFSTIVPTLYVENPQAMYDEPKCRSPNPSFLSSPSFAPW